MGIRTTGVLAAVVALSALAAACSDDDDAATTSGEQPTTTAARATSTTATAGSELDEVVDIGDGRTLYVRCTGEGSPTVFMEGGDDDSSSYRYAESKVAAVTRTCVYDRANLGRSGAATGPRQLADLVGDVERLVAAAEIPGPFVLVGTSGGGYISAGFALAHPDQTAGLVLVETAAPFVDAPPEVVAETAWDHPDNVEQRDFLQVERDAWAARKEIGDIPVTIISNGFGPEATSPSGRSNVEDQKGWLVLSPRAQQVVVQTGHAVEEEDPQLVIDAILEVVEAARG